MSEKTRFAALCLIWGVFALLALAVIIIQGTDANFILLAVMALAAMVGTDSVVKSGKNEGGENTAETEKAKRGSSSDLLSLLDEDDIADLRARVKTRLMNTIEGGSDGELSALDQLLAEQQSKRK